MNLKINTDKEVLTIQNKTHLLNGFLTRQFVTNKLDSFKDYLARFSSYYLCYDLSRVSAWLVSEKGVPESGAIEPKIRPLAVCSLGYSDELKLLKKSINTDVKEDDFLYLIRRLANHGNVMGLYDSIENLRVKKIVSMSRSKDSRGNFSYEYSMKDEGKSTFFDPPKKIYFKIPIFKHIEKVISFDLDFVFSYKTGGLDENKRIITNCRLEKFNIDQFIEKSCMAIIEDQMKTLENVPKYWGEIHASFNTDEWKYKDVPMKFEGDL